MAVDESRAVSRHLRTLFQVGTVVGLSDGELLNRFSGGPDEIAEAAFAAMVERHGRMVLRVCRGVLDNPHDAEDAFQATFLVLALRANAVRDRDSLASWLFGVARRAANKAKIADARRRVRERRGAETARSHESTEPPESWPELHEEIDRLPEKYRAPLVLCYLSGLTHEETADRLRLPLGTVKVRLSRARDRLRGRLIRRGLAPTLLAASLEKASGATPSPLLDSTVKAALRAATGRSAGVSASIETLVKGVLQAMMLTRWKVAAAFMATTLSLLLATSFALTAANSQQPPAASPPPDGPRKVVIETIKKTNLGRTTLQAGTVHAFESADLIPKFPGFLKSLNVDIGDSVKKGQLLAEIDAPELAADEEKSKAVVEQAQARVAGAKARVDVGVASWDAAKAKEQAAVAVLSGAESTLAYQEKALVRLKGLVDKGATEVRLAEEAESKLQKTRAAVFEVKSQLSIAKAGVEEAKAMRIATMSDVGEAEADLHVAQAERQKALIRHGYTRIVSPLDGIVTRRELHVGDFVRSGEANAVPLLTISATGKMRVVVQVPENDVPLLGVGAAVTVRFASMDREYPGKIARTAFAEDPTTRTVRTEIDLDNADGQLRPGQFASVTIHLKDRASVLTIPRSALVNLRIVSNQTSEADCYRIVDGRAILTHITVGEHDGTRFEVLDGLKEGDAVIGSPGAAIKDGEAIDMGAKESPSRK